MPSHITGVAIVFSTVCSGADQRKHQSFASLACVSGIHRGPVNSANKWPVTQKMFPFGDVIMFVDDPLEISSPRMMTAPWIYRQISALKHDNSTTWHKYLLTSGCHEPTTQKIHMKLYPRDPTHISQNEKQQLKTLRNIFIKFPFFISYTFYQTLFSQKLQADKNSKSLSEVPCTNRDYLNLHWD